MSARVYQYAESTKDLNKLAGKSVYVLLYDGQMAASTRISDLNTFLKDEDILMYYGDDTESYAVYYGLLLNPEALPVEIPIDNRKNDLFLIKYDNYTTVTVDDEISDMEDIVEAIEGEMLTDDALDIDSFSILLGQKIDFMLQIKSPGFVINAGGLV